MSSGAKFGWAMVLSIIMMVINAVTTSVWWDWFVIGPDGPFTTLPPISVAQAFGILLLINFTISRVGTKGSEPSSTKLGEVTVAVMAYYIIAWIFAIAIKLVIL